jgi:hypothetical protein
MNVDVFQFIHILDENSCFPLFNIIFYTDLASSSKFFKPILDVWLFHPKTFVDFGTFCTKEITFVVLTPKGPRGPKWVVAKTGHVITNCDLF